MPKRIGIRIIRYRAGMPSLEKLDELCRRQAEKEIMSCSETKMPRINCDLIEIFRQKSKNL